MLAGGAALVPLVLGCSEDLSSGGEETRALRELEKLAFVPPRKLHLLPNLGHYRYSDLSLERSIVIDVYELTRAELDALFAENATDESPRARRETWRDPAASSEQDADWPAFLDWHEAQRVAAWRGMRLPTAREWLHVAVGARGLEFPWGFDQESVANTIETGVGSPTPVGTFENGRGRAFGCYDLVGNVWEWVQDSVPGNEDEVAGGSREFLQMVATARAELFSRAVVPSFTPEDARHLAGAGARVGVVSALGGSYASRRRETYRAGEAGFYFHARRFDTGTLDPALGARMCADAEEYLWNRAGEWGTGASARARVRAVGARWGRNREAAARLLALLEELLGRDEPPEPLRWLLVGVEDEVESA